MQTNTPELWDRFWSEEETSEQERLFLLREENSVRWQRMECVVMREFGSFDDLKVIEMGAGVGTYAALMAKRGARVTVLDFSDLALARARSFFERNGLSAGFVQGDALSLPLDMLGKFDVSMSFGLTEHFRGADRVNINKAHVDVLRRGGVAFICVPNRYNPPYRIFKFVAERMGAWRVGQEFPYSRRELREICSRIGIREFEFFGDSVFSSLFFLSPIRAVKKVLGLKLKVSRIRKQKGTILDPYLSYALLLCGKKA